MPTMDVAGVIWMTVFGIVIGAAVLAGGIFIYRFFRAYWNADRDSARKNERHKKEVS